MENSSNIENINKILNIKIFINNSNYKELNDKTIKIL